MSVRKTQTRRKWWIPQWWAIWDSAVVQTYMIAGKIGWNFSKREVMIEIVDELLKLGASKVQPDLPNRLKPKGLSTTFQDMSVFQRRDGLHSHDLIQIKSFQNRQEQTRRKCVVCAAKNWAGDNSSKSYKNSCKTSYMCKQCELPVCLNTKDSKNENILSCWQALHNVPCKGIDCNNDYGCMLSSVTLSHSKVSKVYKDYSRKVDPNNELNTNN